MVRLKELFLVALEFLKRKHIAAGIVAAIVGVLCAISCAAAVILSLNFGVIDVNAGKTLLSSAKDFTSSLQVVSEDESDQKEENVIQPVEKKIEYKGKSVNVVKQQVAKANSTYDGNLSEEFIS